MDIITIGFLIFAGYPMMTDAMEYWFFSEPPKECWTRVQETPEVFRYENCDVVLTVPEQDAEKYNLKTD